MEKKSSSWIAWVSAICFAAILFTAGLAIVFLGSGSREKNLTDFGAAIGGAWALSAGLLAYSATIWGVSRQERDRVREVANVCVVEIDAVWIKLYDEKVIANLRQSSLRLDSNAVDSTAYRGSIGDAWLCLQSSNPEAFGVLPHDVAMRVTRHYSRLRNIMVRLNWMNATYFKNERYHEVLGRQNTTESELNMLLAEKDTLLNSLRLFAGISNS